MLSKIKKQKSEVSFLELALRARIDEQYGDYVIYLQEGYKNNEAECSYLLGSCYVTGICGISEDLSFAYKLFFENATTFKHIKSMVCCYIMLKSGQGCKKYKKLRKYFKKMVLNSDGNHCAKGDCYKVCKNEDKAFVEYNIAAEEGDDEAQLAMGSIMLEHFKFKDAFDWFLKSEKQGNLYAVKKLYFMEFSRFQDFETSLNYGRKCYKIYRKCGFLNDLNKEDLSSYLTNDELDSIIHKILAIHYFAKKPPLIEYMYLSWYFARKSKHMDAKKLLETNDHIFFRFEKCKKAILALLCCSKYSRQFPKDIWIMLSKYVWKTKLDDYWIGH
jgi:hypothetical protein